MMRRMLRLRRGISSAGFGQMGSRFPALSRLQFRMFRGAPLVIWLAAWTLNDLRSPDSRIRKLARRLTGKASTGQTLVISVEPPAALNEPEKHVQENRRNG